MGHRTLVRYSLRSPREAIYSELSPRPHLPDPHGCRSRRNDVLSPRGQHRRIYQEDRDGHSVLLGVLCGYYPQTILSTQAPKYTGVFVALAAFIVDVILFSILYVVYSRENVARRREIEESGEFDEVSDLANAFSRT